MICKKASVQQGIADDIFTHVSEVSLIPIGELAANCDTSETAVMRFLRKLEFDSYQVFRVHVAREIHDEHLESIYGETDRGDAIETLVENVVASAARSGQIMRKSVGTGDS